jgi:hypothetical protein
MPDVILENESVTIFGPPDVLEMSIERGPQGIQGNRGNVIYTGSLAPLSNPGAFTVLPPVIGDLYVQNSEGNIDHGTFYRYELVSGNATWVIIIRFNDLVDQFFEDNPDYLLDYVTDFDAESTYLKIIDASNIYLPLSSASSTYLTQEDALSTYLPTLAAQDAYLQKQDALLTFLTQTSASIAYVEIVSANSASVGYVKKKQSITEITSTTYTINSGNVGSFLLLNNSNNIVVTVPQDASPEGPLDLMTGHKIDFIQMGNGQVTFSGASGVSVVGNPGTRTNGQYSQVSLLRVGSNSWVLYGNTAS